MTKYTSFYDRVFICLHNSAVRLIRHFFLIPLRWRIRQILLYMGMYSEKLLVRFLLDILKLSLVDLDNSAWEFDWCWERLLDKRCLDNQKGTQQHAGTDKGRLKGYIPGADPACNFRGTISEIFGSQVSLRSHSLLLYRWNILHNKTTDGKMALYHEYCFPKCKKSWWKKVTFVGFRGWDRSPLIRPWYILHPTALKIICKSFCEVDYANFGQTYFGTVRGYQWRFG